MIAEDKDDAIRRAVHAALPNLAVAPGYASKYEPEALHKALADAGLAITEIATTTTEED